MPPPRPPLELRVLPDADAVARAAAELFATLAADAVRARGRFTVALSGGATPRALHAHLASGDVGRDLGPLPWGRTFVFFGDERAVPPDDPASNYRMARETLLSHASVPGSHVFRMEGEATDRDAAARRYETALRGETAVGGGLDLVFLGLGEDGHTASLFPGSPALTETSRLVVPSQAPPNVAPRERITLTFPALAAARRVVFLVSGAAKRDALARVRGAEQPLVPAARVTAREGVLWLADVRAADEHV
ncbi:MAG: 6-phosphogluconolactonase [bacterium]